MDSTQRERTEGELCRDKLVREELGQDKIDQDKEEDKLKCSICSEELSSGIKYLNCAHGFHRQCIDDWLELKANCPLCRTHISVDSEPSTYESGDYQLAHDNIAIADLYRVLTRTKTDVERLLILFVLYLMHLNMGAH